MNPRRIVRLYEWYKAKTFCCAFFAVAMLTIVAAATIVRFPPVVSTLSWSKRNIGFSYLTVFACVFITEVIRLMSYMLLPRTLIWLAVRVVIVWFLFISSLQLFDLKLSCQDFVAFTWLESDWRISDFVAFESAWLTRWLKGHLTHKLIYQTSVLSQISVSWYLQPLFIICHCSSVCH